MSTFRQGLFGGTSDLTSAVAFVGDAQELTVYANIASATTVILEGSNATGFREAIPAGDWSNLTTITAVGADALYNIEPGFRWMRAIRESAVSWTEAVIAGFNHYGRR